MAITAIPVEPSAPVANSGTRRSFRFGMSSPFDNWAGCLGVTPFFPTRPGTSFLAVDVTGKGGAFVVSAEMPGVSEDDIQASLFGGTLMMKGAKRRQREEKR